MTQQIREKIKQLEQNLPEGLVVTAAWLEKHGYSASLRSQYVNAGWLNKPARGVFCRPRGDLRWQQVVISLQTLLQFPVVVGGRTALELHGYAHYLPLQEQGEVHLYAPTPLPGWMQNLPLKQRFIFHKNTRLFPRDPAARGLTKLDWNAQTERHANAEPHLGGFDRLPWGHWDWPFAVSTPERALLEILDELPARESFHAVDKFVEGMTNLRPGHTQKLLENCRSVKVKRLLFFFAGRHNPVWLKHIDRENIDLGKGDRMLVRGGRLDPACRITVPEELNAV